MQLQNVLVVRLKVLKENMSALFTWCCKTLESTLSSVQERVMGK